MVNVKIREEDLLDLLMNRVYFWTKQQDTEYYLFEKMYESYIDGECFDGFELDVNVVVDNDYVNNCRVMYDDDEDYELIKKLYDENGGCGDISCESNYGFIEAYDEEQRAFLLRY